MTAKYTLGKHKKICILAILIYLITGITSFATEWVYIKPPALDNKSLDAYDKFWTSVKLAKFNDALRTAKIFDTLNQNNDYKSIIVDSAALIEKHKDSVDENLLSDFIMLEKKRFYWQNLNWWPDNESYNEAMKEVVKLLNGYKKLSEIYKESPLEEELLYRIGLCYADNGGLGLKQYKNAIDMFNTIKNKYSQSNLVDDASLEIIITNIKALKDGEKKDLSVHDIINFLEEFLLKFPDSNREIEAHELLGYHYDLEDNYLLAAKEYSYVVDKFGKKRTALDLLNKLSIIYRFELKDRVKEKIILKRIIKDFPDSYYARHAKIRMETIGKENAEQ